MRASDMPGSPGNPVINASERGRAHTMGFSGIGHRGNTARRFDPSCPVANCLAAVLDGGPMTPRVQRRIVLR